MVYKRYAKKNGKVYGPYYYESYRENGVVKKVYLGQNPSRPSESLDTPKISVVPRVNFSMRTAVVVLVIAVLLLAGYMFIKPTGNVALESQPSYSLNEPLLGEVSVSIESGDFIQKDTAIELSLSKDGEIVADTARSFEGFLGSQIDYITTANDSISCENITTPVIQEVCHEENTSGTTQEVCEDVTTTNPETNETTTEQVCRNETIPGETIEVCVNETVSETTVENCTTTQKTDYYYQTPGKYSREIADLMSYTFDEAGDYVFRIEIPSLGISDESVLHVPESETNATNKTKMELGIMAAPNAPIVYINSSSGYNLTSDNLTCWANAADTDNDNVSYSGFWYKDGVQYVSFDSYPLNYTQGTIVNVSVLDSLLTSVGENWSCEVRAYDGSSYSGYTNSSNLTILGFPINVSLYNPATNTTFTLGKFSEFTVNVTCLQGNCGAINVTLDPEALGFFEILGVGGELGTMAACGNYYAIGGCSLVGDNLQCGGSYEYSAGAYRSCAYNNPEGYCYTSGTCTGGGSGTGCTSKILLPANVPSCGGMVNSCDGLSGCATCTNYYVHESSTNFDIPCASSSGSCIGGKDCGIPAPPTHNLFSSPAGTNYTNSSGAIVTNTTTGTFYLSAGGVQFVQLGAGGNVNLSGAVANTTQKKAFMHFGSVNKANVTTARLQINRTLGSGNGVVVCPGASSFDAVNNSCTNAILLTPLSTNGGGYTLSYDSNYWYVQASASVFSTGIKQQDKDGTIPYGSGVPFYVNVSNPYTTSSLSAGQSELVTWWVNATGSSLTRYEFFAFANLTSNLGIGTETARVNITIMAPLDGLCDGCSDCMYELNNDGIYVNLTQNIAENGTCLNNPSFTNKVFDCNGYSISGNGTGIGINISNELNITIMNCNITRFGEAIRTNGVSYSLFYNNTLNYNNLTGFVSQNSNNLNVTLQNITGNNVGIIVNNSIGGSYSRNTIYSNNLGTNNYGVYLSNSSYLLFEGNKIYGHDSHNIYGVSSTYLTFASNNISNSNGDGINLAEGVSGGHLIYNNTLYGNAGSAVYTSNYSANNTRISYNRIMGTGIDINSSGAYAVSNLTIEYNYLNVSGAYSFGVFVNQVNYSTISHNLLYDNASDQFSLPSVAIRGTAYSNWLNIINNTIDSFYDGIYLSGYSMNINNNNLTRVGRYGIWVDPTLTGGSDSDTYVFNNSILHRDMGVFSEGIHLSRLSNGYNNSISGFRTGIMFMEHARVEDNILSNNSLWSIYPYSVSNCNATMNRNSVDGKPIYYSNVPDSVVQNTAYSEIIICNANNNTVSNVVVNNSRKSPNGILVINSANASILNSLLVSNVYGIYTYSAGRSSLRNNTIYDAINQGVYISSAPLYGSDVVASNVIRNCSELIRVGDTSLVPSSVSVVNNTLYNSRGISVYLQGRNNSFIGNNVSNMIIMGSATITIDGLNGRVIGNNIISTVDSSGGTALSIYDSNGVVSYNNIVLISGVGIRVGGTNSTISDNNIRFASSGIYLSGSGNRISDNYIFNSSNSGIEDRSGSNNLTGNVVLNSSYGIYLASISGSRVYNNYLYGNLKDAYDGGGVGSNYWNTSRDCSSVSIVGGCMGGNLWTTYYNQKNLTDRTGDGIGDDMLPVNSSYRGVPGNVTGNVRDYLPLAVIRCGDELVGNTNITYINNLTNCTSNGLNIIANNVSLDCGSVTISGNSSYYGLNVSNVNNFTVKYCNIINFSTGMQVTNSDYLFAKYNFFLANRLGMNVSAGSDGGLIYNNLFNNTGDNNAYDAGLNYWNNSVLGNFWSDYSTADYESVPKKDYNVSYYGGIPIPQAAPGLHNIDYEPHPLSHYTLIFECGKVIDYTYNNKEVMVLTNLNCVGENAITIKGYSEYLGIFTPFDQSIDNVTINCDTRTLSGDGTHSGISFVGSGHGDIDFSNSFIKNCVINNFSTGIEFRAHAHADASDVVTGCVYYAGRQTAYGNLITNNIIQRCARGISFISDESHDGYSGIYNCKDYCYDADIYDNYVTVNKVRNNTVGIYFSNSPDSNDGQCGSPNNEAPAGGDMYANVKYNYVVGNIVKNNTLGIFLTREAPADEYPKDNWIYNNLFNNTNNSRALTEAQSNSWNLTRASSVSIVGGPYSGGNYWSNYNGSDDGTGSPPHDIAGDYIGDTDLPYNNSANMSSSDWLPLLYYNTLANMEQVFVNSTFGTNSSGENLTCWASATDEDGDLLNYTGYWYKDGVLNESINASGNYAPATIFNVSTLLSSYLSYGENWSCYIQVFDSHNYSTYLTSGNLTIRDITAPNITILMPLNATYLNDSNVNFSINISDSESGLANATLYLYNATGLYNQTTITLGGVFQATVGVVVWLADGIYNWFWEVFDLANNFATTQDTLGNYTVTGDTSIPSTIEFVPPTETSGSVYQRANIVVNVSVNDSNFANVTVNLYNLTALVNSTTSADNPFFINFTDLADGIYYFNASAYDLAGNLNYSETRNVTIGNSLPVFVGGSGAVIINSTYGTNLTDENLTCWANATDSDGNNISYSGFWYKDGVQYVSFDSYPLNYTQGTIVNVSVLDSLLTSVGENWICSVRAYDGISYSNYVNSSNLTILNSPPIMSSVFANSTLGTNYTNEDLTCWANATDSDGNLLNYTGYWYKDGVLNESINASGNYAPANIVNVSTLPYSYLSSGENWSCRVRAYDGRDYSNYMFSNNITIRQFIDGVAPNYYNLSTYPASPAVYAPGQTYMFNSTWIDNLATRTVRITFNGTNYTLSGSGNGVYNFTISDLGVGNYSYRWFANDSAGNSNQTDWANYTVVKADISLMINITPLSPVTDGTLTNASGSGCPAQLTCTLYRDDVAVLNPELATLAAGTYNYTFNATGNENYSSGSVSEILVVNPAGTNNGNNGCHTHTWTCGNWSTCISSEQTRDCVSNCLDTKTEKQECACTPNWECTDFGVCNGETHFITRTCADLNACGVGSGKPEERERCKVSKCGEDYRCSNWSKCEYSKDANDLFGDAQIYDGVMERLCVDANNCGENLTEYLNCKPVEGVEVGVKGTDFCGEPIMELIDKNNNVPVTSISLRSWYDNRLDISFIQEEAQYCPSCYNGVKDNNEEGIDCGGICRACKPESWFSIALMDAILIIVALLMLIPVLKMSLDDRKIIAKIRELIISGEEALKAGDRKYALDKFRNIKLLYIQLESGVKKKMILKEIQKYHRKVRDLGEM